MPKPRVAVYKFSSCDGCQLAFLNSGPLLLQLSELVDIVHFAEAGPVDMDAAADISFVEGSVTTPDEVERIKKIREHSKYIITIGACATAGGVQALRNYADTKKWVAGVYASPEYIETLETSTPISEHVKVDLELWGCPVNTHQVMSAVRSLLFGVPPEVKRDAVCIECKRRDNVCVVVAKGEPCMGPVTQTGCGALCPSASRGCYACYGPSENPNTDSLARWFAGFGIKSDRLARLFLHINNHAKVFNQAGLKLKNEKKQQ